MGGGGGCFGFACPSAGQSNGGGSLGNPNCNGGTCVQCSNDSQCDAGQRCSRFLNGICVQCTEKSQCKAGYSCDRLVGRCGPICTETSDCENGRVCDTAQGTCVPCIDGSACQNDFDPDTRICYMRRCVECVISADCPPGERDVCNKDFQCVQCVSDQDCKDNGDGQEHCDVPRGRCE